MNIRLYLGAATSFLILVMTVGPTFAQQASEFIAAVTGGDVDKVKAMLQQEPKLVRATDKDGASAILKAVYYRKNAVLDVLLATGVELDIFEASATGKTERARTLLRKDPSLANAFAADGFYPLGLAAFFAHKETVELLLNSGAKVETAARNQMKVTALHAAAAAQQLEIARMLVAHGADVNARQQEDFTPLHEAAANGQLEFAKLLLDHGADVNLRTAKGKTALSFAMETGQTQVANLLRERGGIE